MLILERKCDEQIVIGDDIVLTITEIRWNSVRIGVDADPSIPIMRDELIGRQPKPQVMTKPVRQDGQEPAPLPLSGIRGGKPV